MDQTKNQKDKNNKLERTETWEISTLRARAMATPTMKSKKGITKSAKVQPFHGE